jgi:hypothetical protein
LSELNEVAREPAWWQTLSPWVWLSALVVLVIISFAAGYVVGLLAR